MGRWISLECFKITVANLVVITAAGLLVAACDGIGWTGQRVIHESPSGFYRGPFTSTATQPSPNREAIGIISEEFDAHFLLSDQHYAGIVAVDGNTLSGTLTTVDGEYSGLAFYSIGGAVDFLYLGSDNGLFAFANQFQRL